LHRSSSSQPLGVALPCGGAHWRLPGDPFYFAGHLLESTVVPLELYWRASQLCSGHADVLPLVLCCRATSAVGLRRVLAILLKH
jgi:hypothetical protein